MSEGGCELGFSDARARILSTILYLTWGMTVTVFPMVCRELTVAFPHSSIRQGLLTHLQPRGQLSVQAPGGDVC